MAKSRRKYRLHPYPLQKNLASSFRASLPTLFILAPLGLGPRDLLYSLALEPLASRLANERLVLLVIEAKDPIWARLATHGPVRRRSVRVGCFGCFFDPVAKSGNTIPTSIRGESVVFRLTSNIRLGRFSNFELGHKEAVHVVHVGIKPPRELEGISKRLVAIRGKAFLAEFKTRVDELDVRSLAQSIGHDGLVLFDSDRTCRVHNEPTRGRVGRHRIDRRKDELFLQMRKQGKVSRRLWGQEHILRLEIIPPSPKGPNGALDHVIRTLLTLTLASLLMTPVPLHGASSRTRSNPPITLGNSRPS
jgi:hypothetical protein